MRSAASPNSRGRNRASCSKIREGAKIYGPKLLKFMTLTEYSVSQYLVESLRN